MNFPQSIFPSLMYLELNSWGKQGVFWGYILTCSFQAILMHNSGTTSESRFEIRSTSVVLMQDVVKLLFCLSMIGMNSPSWRHCVDQIASHKKYALYYLVPAALYFLYNNLAFVSLSNFDPTTYFVLMQFRIVIVTFCSIVFLKKIVSTNQWLGVVIVTSGALMKILDSNVTMSFSSIHILPFLLVQLQLVLSAAAGLYNEYLLQGRNRPSTEIQNIFMYLNSILVGLVGSSQSVSQRVISAEPLTILAMVLTGSAAGLFASYFLRYLDSVRKSIASAIELWITAVLSAIVFGYPISAVAILGLAVITFGIIIYSRKLEKKEK